jgi:hypothetical protein
MRLFDIEVRNLYPDEIHIPIEWAREEGWNPGIHDGECEYPVDPEGWFCVLTNDMIIGVGAATNYDDNFSFMGYYIVKPGYRQTYAGIALIRAFQRHVGSRNLGIDGVFELQQRYADSLGMKLAYRNIRWEGVAEGIPQPDLVPVQDLPFEKIFEYDSRHFPADRRKFLERWIDMPESHSLACTDGREIRGYGTIRKCFTGHKIGPLFANDPLTAEKIFQGLTSFATGDPVFLDTPEPNDEAVALARRHGMAQVFGTARMYSNYIPKLPIEEIYGVTTFELG